MSLEQELKLLLHLQNHVMANEEQKKQYHKQFIELTERLSSMAV